MAFSMKLDLGQLSYQEHLPYNERPRSARSGPTLRMVCCLNSAINIAMNPSLSIAANGHVTLDFGEYDSVAYHQVCAKLENELGFSRQGNTIVGLDEGISPSFLHAELEISARWGNWSGSYLLANSDAGDTILRSLHTELV